MTLNPQQFQQLPMFMSAREINRTRVPDNDARAWRPNETKTQIYARKLREARGSGLDRDIATAGVEQPVKIMASRLLDGHHRMAVSLADRPDALMPVLHYAKRRDSYSADDMRAWPSNF